MLDHLSVEEIQKNINNRQISIKEVLVYYLERIEKFNKDINAIVLQKDRELLIKEAEQKDNLKNSKKILNGLPIAIKDLSDVVGLKTTYGYEGSKNNSPKKNSLFVDKLIDNGAIIIGKTAGSSGGASSAVAAGLLPFGDGTDQMGSCRGPAAYANIYGYRPTPGLIAADRTYQNFDIPILTTPGCFAKTPNDMAFLIDAITGSHPLDNISFDLNSSFRDAKFSEKEFSNLKIGWLSNMNDKYIIEKSILDICEKKLKDLEKNNLEIEYLKPNIDTDTLWNSWTTFRSKSIYQDTLSMGIKDIDSMTFQAIWEYNKGKDIKSDNLKLAFEQKKRCTEQVNEIFDKFDFLALPSAQLFPFDKSIQFPSKINETSLDTYHRWLEVFIISSLLELPTITIPVGFNENGLPMGMQIIGKNKDDLKLFAFAKIFEEIYNNSNHKPKLN